MSSLATSFRSHVCVLLGGLAAAVALISAPAGGETLRHPVRSDFVQFDVGIPGVTHAMIDPGFWCDTRRDADRLLMTPEEIFRYNRLNIAHCEPLVDIRTHPRVLRQIDVRQRIDRISTRPTRALYLAGSQLQNEYFQALEDNINRAGVPSLVRVRFGVTVRRTEMRTFPTHDRVFSDPEGYEFDRFIETALYPLEPLALLHTSADGQWYLAQATTYLAWVPARDVAIADRQLLFAELESNPFLVVTGKRVFTGFNPFKPGISELQLDMGVRIPLADKAEIPLDIDGQHPAGNFVVKLPVRDADGRVEWQLGLISRSDDVHVGYLPLTRRNIIRQAFKFLGQRYGWGGMFNSRDCSSFIMDNFRTMGVLLPRNASEQGKLAYGITHAMPKDMSLAERKRLFQRLPPATPVYMAGHAMLYLGSVAGDHFIIHDFAGIRTRAADGTMQQAKTRCVFITPLLQTFLSNGEPYIAGLFAAREFLLPARAEP